MVWNHGLFMTFDILKNVIIPTDFYVFQRGRYTTNQIMMSQHFCWYIGDSYVLHIWWVFELVRMYVWDTLRLFMFLFPYFFPKHAPSYIQRLQISILSLALKTWMVSPTTRASNAFMSFSWGCQEDDWVIDCVIVFLLMITLREIWGLSHENLHSWGCSFAAFDYQRVTAWWFGTWLLWLSIQLGMSSSQLTFMFFQSGRAQPPTNG